jgi:DNA-binding SARP family transcriptional activator
LAPPLTHLTVFGIPHISRDGREVAVPVRKTLALVVFLALEGRSSRARLSRMFWSGLEDAAARRNLRHALHRLRAAGLGDVLIADDEQVTLTGVSNDLQAFEQAVASGRLDAAHELRTGRLLEGLDLEDAAEFDDWLRGRREQVLRAWRAAMSRHADQLESKGDLRTALAVHRRLLEDDPLQEAAYRDLMRLHDALGERAAALELFERCARTLHDELGLEPLPETRLLAERIRARPAQAAAGSATAPASVADRGAPAPRFDLRKVPLVARERELAAAAALQTSLVLIEGEAGVGKSRFALELARNAGPDGTRDEDLLVVRFTEMSSSTPFSAVADALRSAPAVQRIAALDPIWQRDITRLLPEIGLDIDRPGDESTPTPAEARTRLLEALAQALALAAGPARTVLFDDLQWADASSLELLAHLARRRRHAPNRMARVLATARNVELSDNPQAGVALQAIASERNLSRLPLGAFDEWSMLQLIQRLSGSEGGLRFAARLVGATGGNVFFALETLRALFESGELRLDPAEGWSTRYDSTTTDYAELPLPASVVEAVRSRVARLGAAAQRVLETAALAEEGSTLAEIQGATALSEWEALEGIERAVVAHVVNRSGPGYRFVHDLFRTAIRSGLSPERQRLTHAKLAAALEPLQVSPARIAAHWQQAGQAEPAAKAWIRAAEAAVAMDSHLEAIEHYGHAAELVTDVARTFDLLDLRLLRMRMAGVHEGRSAMLARMLALAERVGSPTLQFRALARAADLAAEDRQMELSERYSLRALREFEPPNARYRVHALSCAAYAAGYLDRPEESLQIYLQAIEVARDSVPFALGSMAAAAAMTALRLGRLDEAVALRNVALPASEVSLVPIARAQILSKCSFVTRALGDRASALADTEESIAIARRTHMEGYLPAYLANQCETLVDDGQHGAAGIVRQAFAEEFANPGVATNRYLCAISAAPVHAALGKLGAAIDAARTAIDLADELGHLSDRREARLLCAALLIQIGADSAALELADQAETLVHPGAKRVMLAVESVRAAVQLSSHPALARDRLQIAIAAPFTDRLLHPHLEAARVLLGRCELSLRQPEAARQAVRDLRHGVALEADALAVRLSADAIDGPADPASLSAALGLLDGERLPPLHALALMRVLASIEAGNRGRRKPGASSWHARMQATAQSLADSLRRTPPLQAAFIRKHRDLLT